MFSSVIVRITVVSLTESPLLCVTKKIQSVLVCGRIPAHVHHPTGPFPALLLMLSSLLRNLT